MKPPKGQVLWVIYSDAKGKEKWAITSDAGRTKYHLYFFDGKWEKVKTAESPAAFAGEIKI